MEEIVAEAEVVNASQRDLVLFDSGELGLDVATRATEDDQKPCLLEGHDLFSVGNKLSVVHVCQEAINNEL